MVLNSFSFCLSVKLFISPSDLNGFPGGSDHKEPVCNVGDPCIPGSGRSPGEGNSSPLQYSWASLVAQRLKHLPPMRETRVRSLGWEDPLEKEMVTHSSILAWRIPWTEEPGRLQSMGWTVNSWTRLSDFTFPRPVASPTSHLPETVSSLGSEN